jgi:hypothetical protein
MSVLDLLLKSRGINCSALAPSGTDRVTGGSPVPRIKFSSHASDHLLPLNLNSLIIFCIFTCREAADRDDRIKFLVF